MLRIAAGITGLATLALVVVVALRALAQLRADLRTTLIAEAEHDEYSADLLLWEDEIQESRNDAQP